MAGASAVLLGSMSLLPGLARAADEIVWTADQRVVMDNGVQLIVRSGSAAKTFTVSSTTITVTVNGANTLVIDGATSSARLNNDAGLDACNRTSGLSRLTVDDADDTGDTTIVITPVNGCGGDDPSESTGGGGGSVPVPAAPACVILAPNGGETLGAGAVQSITWQATGNGIADANLYYSVDGGLTYGLLASGKESTSTSNGFAWTVPNTATTQGRVKVECRDAGGGVLATDVSNANFSIAASTAVPPVPSPGVVPVGTMTRTEANARLPLSAPVDSLVKLSTDSAVYYVGLDGKRHPFPTSQIFFSWYSDFSRVRVISSADMAAMTMGAPILARPGSHWVKIQSDPKTYYVAPGYTLRWVKDEATARTLGGSDWNKNIIDVEPTYFTKFKMGADIDANTLATSWPAGALVKSSADAKVWYVTPTGRREVSAGAMSSNAFQAKFIETTDAAGWKALPVEAMVTGQEDVLFSFQNL